MTVKLYSGTPGMLPGMSSAAVPRPDLSRICLDGDPLDLSGFTEAESLLIRHRHGVLMCARRLRARGLSAREAVSECGEPPTTYYRWAKAFRRAHGNPASLLDRSRARKTPPDRTAWTAQVAYFVLMAHNAFMVNPSDLAYAFALNHSGHPSVSERPMARVVSYLRDEKGLIDAAERGKKPLKNGRKRVCERPWAQALKGDRDLLQTGHYEVDHMVVTPSKKCCAARVFGAKDKVCGMMYARAFKSATAADARAFFDYLIVKSDGDVKSMQCDNGSEFKGEFEERLEESGIARHTIPPSSPTWNHIIENGNNMMRIRVINFGLDAVETIEQLNEKLESVLFVHNHTPKSCLPLASAYLGLPRGTHLTPYQCHCLINGKTPEIIIPFGPYNLADHAAE